MDGEGGGEIGHVLFDLLLNQKLFLVETLGIFHEAVLKRDIFLHKSSVIVRKRKKLK